MENINDQNFEEEIKNTDKFVLVDFFAVWCGPCLVLGPILEKVASGFKEKVVLVKANIDEFPKIAQKFEIDRIPAVFLFKAGKLVDGFIGLKSEEDIKNWLTKIWKQKN